MDRTYIVALIESLEKKIGVLEEIRKVNVRQDEIIKKKPFSFNEFDVTSDEKSVLIYKLNKLDEGFELVYEKVREELDKDRASYKDDIKKMQDLITKITDMSTAIQAEEARNKAGVEKVFKDERSKLKANRSGVKAVKSYSQAMQYKPK